MIQQKKWYFNSETVITAQNVQKIAELITVGAVKNVMNHSSRDLYRLYKGLLADIYRPQDSLELYSDGYDYVQEAICFLCNYLGKKTSDLCTDKFGKKAPVSTACARHIGRLLFKNYRKIAAYETCSLEDTTSPENTIKSPAQPTEKDYHRYDTLIKKMSLRAYEYDTLCALMSGMQLTEMSKFFNVNRTTIYRRKLAIQKKYLSAANAVQ